MIFSSLYLFSGFDLLLFYFSFYWARGPSPIKPILVGLMSTHLSPLRPKKNYTSIGLRPGPVGSATFPGLTPDPLAYYISPACCMVFAPCCMLRPMHRCPSTPMQLLLSFSHIFTTGFTRATTSVPIRNKGSPLILFVKDIEKSMAGNTNAYTSLKSKVENLPSNVVVIGFHTQMDNCKEKSHLGGLLSTKFGANQTALLYLAFPDNFGRFHGRGKEIPKTMKQVTRLFPNKVMIQLPQVC